MPKMESAARELVLGRIRAANAGAGAEVRAAAYEGVVRGYQQTAELHGDALVELFAERLREYDAQVHAATGESVREVVAKALAASGQRGAVVAAGFRTQWLPEGFELRAEADVDTDALGRVAEAIAACEVAIAHTGSIVVRGARRFTLLPDRLLCVVEERQIVETVPEAFSRLEPYATDALTFISGPSATADIEMTRIRGVHGPRFLDVVLVRG